MRLSSLALSLALAAPPALAQQPDYQRLAADFLARHDVADADPATFDLHAILTRDFARLQIGLFELWVPAHADARRVEELQEIAVALIEAQERWLDWLEPAAGDLRESRKDARAIAKWIDGWRPGVLADAVGGGARDVLDALEAKPDVRAAAERFGASMVRGEALGLAREDGAPEPLILIQDRREFAEMLCFGGWLYPHLQSVFWVPSIGNWTHFYLDQYKVLALQYAAPGRPQGDVSGGISMNARKPNGMQQQITQLAANSMLDHYFGEAVPPSLAGAMAVNLVVDVFGECDTRVDGDLRARRTSAREMFVPGGRSEGGVLPPNLADSRWRDGHGADRFVQVLQRAMSSDGRRSRRSSEPPAFELLDDREVARETIAAPFLGSAAASKPTPPERFFGDHLEFLRAYRSCFVHWLQTESDRSEKKSRQAFAELLRTLARGGDAARIEEVLTAAYEAPLSDPELERETLEARFLSWLAKQK